MDSGVLAPTTVGLLALLAHAMSPPGAGEGAHVVLGRIADAAIFDAARVHRIWKTGEIEAGTVGGTSVVAPAEGNAVVGVVTLAEDVRGGTLCPMA